MAHFYNNRQLSEKLKIKLSRWKRWSRAFLPPDPLGGMQSGYARQYAFKDLFKVYLGGHLLSHHKMGVPQAQIVLAELSPWLKQSGYTTCADVPSHRGGPFDCRVFIVPAAAIDADAPAGYRYLVQRTLSDQVEADPGGLRVRARYAESFILADDRQRSTFFRHPEVRMVNLGAVYRDLCARLQGGSCKVVPPPSVKAASSASVRGRIHPGGTGTSSP